MTEPRARARPRGQFFSTADLSELLYAYGDQPPSLPATISALDEILMDFIIETCHQAALSASYSRRQKIKVDDFKWALRRDEVLLGRVLEQMWKEKGIKEDRKAVDFDNMEKEALGAAQLADVVEVAGVGGETKKKGRKGKRKAATTEAE